MASDLYANTMKAACYFDHGGAPIDIVDSFPKPVIKDGELLIKVLTASVNPIDIKLHQNNFSGLIMRMPKVPGCDFCGIVEEIANPSGRVSVGDRVMGMLTESYFKQWGTCAEFVAMNEFHVVKVPVNMSDAEAASLPLVSTVVVQALKPFVDAGQY
jgi:NADPH:quinone reductase-like Zn-dependent oxidoreductase